MSNRLLVQQAFSGSEPAIQSLTSSTSSDAKAKQFSVHVNQSETSGVAASQLMAGVKTSVVLGLSPTSSFINRARLKAILEWLLPRAEHVTILEGSWFHRWDLVVFGKLAVEEATKRALHEMRRIQRRIHVLAVEFGVPDRISVVPWPETHDLAEMRRIRADLLKASERSDGLAKALRAAVADYLGGLPERQTQNLVDDDRSQLLNYVIEELATFVYLTLHVSPLELYPGADLPLMRRFVAGEFRDVFPYDLSRRSHISLELIDLAAGFLREGTTADWPEIERLICTWPTHFIDEAMPLIRVDFFQHRTMLCDDGNGRVLGFMIWRSDGSELELLWMAVDPSYARRGVCSSVVRAVLCQRSHERRVFGRTATTNSVIPGTAFSGLAYEVTYRFFQSLGFTFGARHEGYWGSQNHMIEIERLYDR